MEPWTYGELYMVNRSLRDIKASLGITLKSLEDSHVRCWINDCVRFVPKRMSEALGTFLVSVIIRFQYLDQDVEWLNKKIYQLISVEQHLFLAAVARYDLALVKQLLNPKMDLSSACEILWIVGSPKLLEHKRMRDLLALDIFCRAEPKEAIYVKLGKKLWAYPGMRALQSSRHTSRDPESALGTSSTWYHLQATNVSRLWRKLIETY